MAVARSCPEARHHCAKLLESDLADRPRGTVRPCHVAAGLAWSGLCGSALPHAFDSPGLPCDAFFVVFHASLALLSAKCCSSFCFFNKVLENIERCQTSEKYVKGGRFDSSLTWSNVKTLGKRVKQGLKMGQNRGLSNSVFHPFLILFSCHFVQLALFNDTCIIDTTWIYGADDRVYLGEAKLLSLEEARGHADSGVFGI